MPKLRVDGTVYDYPSAGREPGYGEDATGWAEGVTGVLDSLSGLGTINETQSTIDNNVLVPSPIAGFVFSASQVEGADISYRVYRKTDTQEFSEKGTLSVVYKPGDADKWFISREISVGDDSQLAFDIDVNGQVTYTSSNVTGANYMGFIKFKTSNILKF